jgi:1-deoxy-D-xylulose-5-phosphate synthase
VVDIYSTFLQRSYDQIFQEVALQNLPVVFTLDRAGVVGADGPTHHGSYDLASIRVFPNLVVMAPGDAKDVAPMVDFALGHDAPVSIRYPKANLEMIDREVQPIELGQAEILEWETDGMFLACGTLVGACLRAAERLRDECGLRVGVINARFVKPLDRTTVLKAIEECGFVITVEEGCLMGGFGSAVLEAANDAGFATAHVRRLGLPDRFILHAERDEQLAEVGLEARQVGVRRQVAADQAEPRLRLHRLGQRLGLGVDLGLGAVAQDDDAQRGLRLLHRSFRACEAHRSGVPGKIKLGGFHTPDDLRVRWRRPGHSRSGRGPGRRRGPGRARRG